jgi:hypothetical protein
MYFNELALIRSGISLAEGSGLDGLDPLIDLTHAKLARPPVPRQSLLRIGAGAAYAGTAHDPRIEGRSQPHSSPPLASVGSPLIK